MAALTFPRTKISLAADVTIGPAPGETALWNTILGVGYPGNPGPMGSNEWRQHLTATGQNAELSNGGNTGVIIPFCNAMPWNPITKRIDISSQDHAGGGQDYVVYDELTDSFITLNEEWEPNGHGYNHNVVNPFTGDMYVRDYGVGPPVTIFKRLFNSTVFNVHTTVSPGVTYTGVANGLCWWRGAFAGGGAEGTLFHVGEGVGPGGIHGCIKGYNPLTNTWFATINDVLAGTPDSDCYHGIAQYSAVKNLMVYGGGNKMENRLWKLNANGTFSELTNTPAGKNCGAATTQGNLVSEPVTGNFLLLSAAELWELNPDGVGSWTQLANPPASLPNPSLSSNCHVVVTELFDHGVVAFIGQATASTGVFWLYKR